MACRPIMCYPPTEWKPPTDPSSSLMPTQALQLQYIYGYRSFYPGATSTFIAPLCRDARVADVWGACAVCVLGCAMQAPLCVRMCCAVKRRTRLCTLQQVSGAGSGPWMWVWVRC